MYRKSYHFLWNLNWKNIFIHRKLLTKLKCWWIILFEFFLTFFFLVKFDDGLLMVIAPDLNLFLLLFLFVNKSVENKIKKFRYCPLSLLFDVCLYVIIVIGCFLENRTIQYIFFFWPHIKQISSNVSDDDGGGHGVKVSSLKI